MASGLARREIRHGNGGLSSGNDEAVSGAFELGDARPELERGGRSVEAVAVPFVRVPLIGHFRLAIEQYGRSAIDGRCERAEAFGYASVAMQESCPPVHCHVPLPNLQTS